MTNLANETKLLSLIRDDALSEDSVVEILKQEHNMDDRAMDAGNEILPHAGDFLFWDLKFFIKAEMSDETAIAIIKHRKEIIRRLCLLFPTIVDLLGVVDDKETKSVLNQIYDVAVDFKAVSEKRTRTHNFKRVKKNIERLRSLVEDLSASLDDQEIVFGREFEEFYRAYKKQVHHNENASISFDEFQKQLEFFAAYLEIFTLRFENGERVVFIQDNKAKTHIVRSAYDITIWHNGPEFVTTPGSQFSMLCSLIFEIATGISDESLAGAINRFARSQERAEIDKEETEQKARESNDDDFLFIKEESQRLLQKIDQLTDEMKSKTLSLDAKMLVSSSLRETIDEYEANEKSIGPFIVWASQLPETYWEEYLKLKEIGETLKTIQLKHDIAAGKSKRVST